MSAKRRSHLPFSHLTRENWQNLILAGLFIFYFFQLGLMLTKDSFLRSYGMDYLAFWSAGRIADEKGYSEIYDLNNLKSTQTQVMEDLGILNVSDNPVLSPIPAPFLPFFVFPFKLLSRVDPHSSYWIWTGFNLLLLIGYLIFFLGMTQPKNLPALSSKRVLILMLFSFPLFVNFTEGQVEVFLLVCFGEFIRMALKKQPLFSGLWLGGLLIKPQLIMIILPVLLIQKNWKVLSGFLASSGVILGTSLILAGPKGLRSLIDLWLKYGAGIASNSPKSMINWRMVAARMDSPLGWIFAAAGIALTLLAVYYLIRNNEAFGTPRWMMLMLGIFSATLALTWHSHFHMMVVLIPFLAYCSLSQMLSQKVVFLWATMTPLLIFFLTIIALIQFFITKTKIADFGSLLLGWSGFVSNFAILGSVLKYFQIRLPTI